MLTSMIEDPASPPIEPAADPPATRAAPAGAMPEAAVPGAAGAPAAAARSGPVGEELPCGADLTALVDQVDSGRLEPVTAHQQHCPDCQAALRDAARSARALGLLAGTDTALPADLIDRVLHEVRRSQPARALLELPVLSRPAVFGALRVHPQVLADLARAAAASNRHVVTVVQCSVAATPGDVIVTMGLLVDGAVPLPELARAVRRLVRRAIQRATGISPIRVELTALDLVWGASA